jgi:hypothetical protein
MTGHVNLVMPLPNVNNKSPEAIQAQISST